MGVAIVIVNHVRLMATRLHEVLPRYTAMPVELISEGLPIQPNRVFIIPEQRDLQGRGRHHHRPEARYGRSRICRKARSRAAASI
jgi:chemotaxis response regulator CheB